MYSYVAAMDPLAERIPRSGTRKDESTIRTPVFCKACNFVTSSMPRQLASRVTDLKEWKHSLI